MKLFVAFILAGLLLVAPDAARPAACSCDGRALCVTDDASADVGAALALSVTLELRSGTNRQLSDELSRIAGKRIAVLPSKPDSVCIKGAALGRVVAELSGLSGQRLRVTSGDEKALVNLSAKGLTLEGIISRLSAQTGAQIGAK